MISRIEELTKYRENGIRTFKEIDIFKEDKLKHEKEIVEKAKKTILRRSHLISPSKKHGKLNENNNSSLTHRSTNDMIDDQHNNTTNLSFASSTNSNNSHDNNSVITNVSNYSSIGSLDNNNFRAGRSERLCSMPGYNLLSENEKKVRFWPVIDK